MKVSYEFQRLINIKFEDEKPYLTGPFSPFKLIESFCKQMGYKMYAGAVRVYNNQSNHTYDHIIIHPFRDIYIMICDMGIEILPMAMYDHKKQSVTITPVYKKYVTTEMMTYHNENMEHPIRSGTLLENMPHPIMVLDEEGFKELFQQVVECDLWLKREDYKLNKN